MASAAQSMCSVNEALTVACKELFKEFIKPSNVLDMFRRILSKQECESIQAINKNGDDIAGAQQLLNILCIKQCNFQTLLKILRHRGVKLQHIADIMEKEWTLCSNDSEKCPSSVDCMQSSVYTRQNKRKRSSSLVVPTASMYMKYNNDLAKNIHKLFMEYVKPYKVVRVFHKYSVKVLTDADIANVCEKTNSKDNQAGSELLLERLVLYENWFDVLLQVLRDPKIKLDQVANEMERVTLSTREKYCEIEDHTSKKKPTISPDKFSRYKAHLDHFTGKTIPTKSAVSALGYFGIRDRTRKTIHTWSPVKIKAKYCEKEDHSKKKPTNSPVTEKKHAKEAVLQGHQNVNNSMTTTDIHLLTNDSFAINDSTEATEFMDVEFTEHYLPQMKEADINEPDSERRASLFHAGLKSSLECVKPLTEIHCDVNMYSKNGDTALIRAAKNGHSECIKLLIDRHCDVNMCNEDGNTALMMAAVTNFSECVKLLINSDCDINIVNKTGDTALIMAAQNGYSECMTLLIDSSCDVNVCNKKGDTALIWAALNGFSECVKLLTDSHCDVNMCSKNGNTALMWAALCGYSKCVKLLIDSGCNVNMHNKNGDTALTLAAINGHSECVKLLIGSDCDVNMRAKNGDTALIVAAFKGHSECVKLIIGSDCDVNMRAKNGDTALILAALKGHSECVKLLIGSDCDVNIRTKNGDTALILAALKGHSECVKLIIGSD